ncbi:MAG: protein kinase [Polyangiaceae bacterium]|nr:protein kinase [Polyangiaceae bacterium]
MNCEACGHGNIEGARFCAKCGALLPVKEEGAADPLIGQLVGGRFRIARVLGEGGMGVVYEGEQQMGSTVRKVAVKTLHQHLSKDPSVLARFHRECGTVAQLEHPNTIKFFDFGATADGTLYIAMEFVKGRALASVIEQEGKLGADRVLKIMKQACGALEEAHKQGIVHRDLKPDNVILTDRAGETDFVKVLDFGIAARRESSDAQKEQKLTQQGMVLGTPPYMSPEQFSGKELDQRSDIYSLGVMTYEMLTGRLPFEADTPWQWATQHLTAQPMPFETAAPALGIPEGMRAAILRALSKDKEQRQVSATAFYEDLAAGFAGSGSEIAPSPGVPSGPTAAMPAFGPPGGAPAPLAAPPPPAYAPAPGGVPVAAVPAPAPRPQSGGGKGIVFAIAGLLGVVGLAIVVILVRRAKPDDEVPLTNPFGTASGVATISATPPASDSTAAVPTEDAGAAGTATAAKTARPPTTTSATGTATAKGPSGAEACAACLSAAQGGNITSASAMYSRCDDAGAKNRCSAAARGTAPGAVAAAVRNNNCAQAKAIAAAANSMGSGAGVNAALGRCR